jgi:phosphotransferase system enzyme I (PtsI)
MGDHVLLDGYNGLSSSIPDDQTLWEYGELEIKKTESRKSSRSSVRRSRPRCDGRHVILSANIELPEDVEQVRQSGAEGVGLYRQKSST